MKLKDILKSQASKMASVETTAKIPRISPVLMSLAAILPDGPDLAMGRGRSQNKSYSMVQGYETIVPKGALKIIRIPYD
jgi:hypothetical protein